MVVCKEARCTLSVILGRLADVCGVFLNSSVTSGRLEVVFTGCVIS